MKREVLTTAAMMLVSFSVLIGAVFAAVLK